MGGPDKKSDSERGGHEKILSQNWQVSYSEINDRSHYYYTESDGWSCQKTTWIFRCFQLCLFCWTLLSSLCNICPLCNCILHQSGNYGELERWLPSLSQFRNTWTFSLNGKKFVRWDWKCTEREGGGKKQVTIEKRKSFYLEKAYSWT